MPQQRRFKDLPCKLVTYCKYGFKYRKLTWIATNLGGHWTPREPCRARDPCEHLQGRRHPECAQRGPSRLSDGTRSGGSHSQNELYSMPEALCEELAAAATAALPASPPAAAPA